MGSVLPQIFLSFNLPFPQVLLVSHFSLLSCQYLLPSCLFPMPFSPPHKFPFPATSTFSLPVPLRITPVKFPLIPTFPTTNHSTFSQVPLPFVHLPQVLFPYSSLQFLSPLLQARPPFNVPCPQPHFHLPSYVPIPIGELKKGKGILKEGRWEGRRIPGVQERNFVVGNEREHEGGEVKEGRNCIARELVGRESKK